MSFYDDAVQVFETASGAAEPADLGILIGDDGALRIVTAEGWRPEALQAHYGARTVFQVTRTSASVRVVARSANQTCTLQSDFAAAFLRPPVARLFLEA